MGSVPALEKLLNIAVRFCNTPPRPASGKTDSEGTRLPPAGIPSSGCAAKADISCADYTGHFTCYRHYRSYKLDTKV
jgi:hypothetical protein